MMKVLFVCNQGKDRSPTAAIVWEKKYGDDTDYIGIYNDEFNHKEKIKWAERVFVMEPHQRKWIADNFPKEYMRLKIECLDIPDMYGYMKNNLIDVLKKNFK
jgi:predicted protein tyrosine phosphatase